MKKIILEEVNRNRQIMGLRPIMEQWEDNILKNLGLDAEKILAKVDADLIPVEKNLLASIEKYAGSDTDKVLRSLQKNTLKDEFPQIAKKLEQELFTSTDQSIAKATQDAFYSKFPDAGAIKKSLESKELDDLVKQYEAKGKVGEIEYQLKNVKGEIEKLPDGFFKDELLKTFESKFGKSKDTAEINLSQILSEFKSQKMKYQLDFDKLVSSAQDSYMSRYTKGKSDVIDKLKTNIKNSLDSLEQVMSNSEIKPEFEALLREVKKWDTNFFQDAYYKVFDKTTIASTIQRMSKTKIGKISLVVIGMAIVGTFGFKFGNLAKYKCTPVIKQAISTIFDVSECNETPKDSKEGGTSSTDTPTPSVELTPGTLEHFKKTFSNGVQGKDNTHFKSSNESDIQYYWNTETNQYAIES